MDGMKRVSQGEWGVDERLLSSLLHMPHKIQRHHEVDDLASLVLHDLGHDSNFGLNKAIYLIDNPEFDCLKGVAGFHKNECALHQEDMWEKPHDFSGDMRNAQFHRTMKEFVQDSSIRRRDVDIHNPDDLVELGTKLGLKNPSFFTWGMRHGNHGVLLFEEAHEACARHRDLLHHAASLLSLC